MKIYVLVQDRNGGGYGCDFDISIFSSMELLDEHCFNKGISYELATEKNHIYYWLTKVYETTLDDLNALNIGGYVE